MNFLKVAFYQGANQALIDLGLHKYAEVEATPGALNPKKKRRAPGLDSVVADRDGMGLSSLNMPEMNIKGKPRVSDVALGNITSSGKKRLDSLQDSLSAMDLAMKGEYVDDGPPAPVKKAPRRAPASKKPAPKDKPLKALFPNSPGLVDAMRLGLTNQERYLGADVPYRPRKTYPEPSRGDSNVASTNPPAAKRQRGNPMSDGLEWVYDNMLTDNAKNSAKNNKPKPPANNKEPGSPSIPRGGYRPMSGTQDKRNPSKA